MAADKINFDDYSHIFTVKYRDEIATLCQPMMGYQDISDISFCLFTHSGEKLWFGTKPVAAIEYVEKGFDRADKKFIWQTHADNTVTFYHEQSDWIESLVESFARQKKYSTFRIYTIVRRCSDCIVTFTVGVPYAIDDPETFYQQTIDKFETFCCDLIDGLIEAIITELPELKPTRFATDQRYREQVIKNREQQQRYDLSEQEQEVLYWTGQGKTNAEIAMILGFSEKTIAAYRSKIIEKMDVSNITQAVFLYNKK